MKNYKKDILSNGITVITEEISSVWSAAVGVWIATGSRYEDINNNGVSHFIEHLLFKGTKTRTATDIAEELDAVGGQLNAFTSKEHTCYYAKVLGEHVPIAVDILSDMICNPAFPAEEIERERGVIIEEIRMYEDSPGDLVYEMLERKMWEDHPIGWSIAGTEERMKSISRKEIMDYFQKHYLPHNMVIAAAGNIKHDEVILQLEEHFKCLAGNGHQERIKPSAALPGAIVRKKDIEQVHLCLGLESYHLTDERLYALYILNMALGGGMSSRLFQEVREKRGLAYTIYSNQAPYKDTGLYSIYAATSPGKLDEVLQLTLTELEKVKHNPLTEKEFLRSKEQLKSGLIMSQEGTASQMLRIGKSQLSFGKIMQTEEVIQKIEAVTMEGIQSVAQELFNKDHYVVSVVGNMDEDVSREKINQILGK